MSSTKEKKQMSYNKSRQPHRPKQIKGLPKFRSQYEKNVWLQNNLSETNTQYEPLKMEWKETHIYTPDLVLPCQLIVELKGLLTVQDKRKMLHVRAQHPNVVLALLFQRSKTRFPRTMYTYADWAIANKFMFASGIMLPEMWLDEEADPNALYDYWLDHPYSWVVE